jgi:hypothetical protein
VDADALDPSEIPIVCPDRPDVVLVHERCRQRARIWGADFCEVPTRSAVTTPARQPSLPRALPRPQSAFAVAVNVAVKRPSASPSATSKSPF